MLLTGGGLLGYTPAVALLLACIMASNTLIAYPIVSRYGLQKKPSVTLSVGSSMLSLLLALIVLAAIVASHEDGGSSIGFWLLFVAKFSAYCTAMILVIPRLTRWFLRRYSDAVMQFIFILAMMFMSAALSELIGLEGIFGAFLSGLILNRYIPPVSPLMNRIEFIGNALFILISSSAWACSSTSACSLRAAQYYGSSSPSSSSAHWARPSRPTSPACCSSCRCRRAT